MHAQQNHASIRRGQGNVRRHLILLFSLFSLFSFLCSLNKKEKGKVERRERESLLRLRFWVPVPSGCMDEGRTYYYRASLLFLDTQVFVPFPMTGGPVAATYQWQRRSRQLLPRHSRTHHAPIPMPALPPPTKQKKKPPSLPPSLPPVNPSSGHHIHPPSRRAYIELLPPFPISPSRATLRPTYHRCPAPEARRTQNPPRSLSHPKSQPRRSWPSPPSFGTGGVLVVVSAPGFMPSRVFLAPPGTRLPAGVHAVVPVPPTGVVVALPEAAAGRHGRLVAAVAARSPDVFVTPPAATGVSAFGDVSSAAVPAGATGRMQPSRVFLAPAGTRLPPGVYTVVAAAAGRTSSRGRGAVLPVAAASGGGPPADAGDADADAEVRSSPPPLFRASFRPLADLPFLLA